MRITLTELSRENGNVAFQVACEPRPPVVLKAAVEHLYEQAGVAAPTEAIARADSGDGCRCLQMASSKRSALGW